MAWSRHRGKLVGALAVVGAIGTAHGLIDPVTRIPPPVITLPAPAEAKAWTRVRGGLREVYLEGTPEAIGAANTRMLRDHMVAGESRLWSDYEHAVPWWLARAFIGDYSRVRYRGVAAGVPEPRRRELAAEAKAFDQDPFASRMPTYQRMLFLYSLYDIALSFEHSPLIGCTSFSMPSKDGHELVARVFDFEADEILDRDKAVYLVREDGAVPFASVAWPGFVGVVTGMNAEGVFLVVHGGRAGEPSSQGTPVAFSLRQALAHSHSTAEAVEILRSQPVMVSHIVFVADGAGRTAIVERAPGREPFVRSQQGTAYVTNHFEGPLAADPANQRVREATTTVDRADRIRALLASNQEPAATEEGVLAMIRDHQCAHDPGCPLGDRRAIDALLATHGVIADATARHLWVSIGPHLSGRFVRLDLESLLSPDHDPATDAEPPTLPEDPILHDGRYDAALGKRLH